MLEHAPDRKTESTFRWTAVALLAVAILVPVRLSARSPREAERTSPPAEAGAVESASPGVLAPSPDDPYVYFLDDSNVMMSGSMGDLDRAREARRDENDSLLWFRHDGREYVVRDPAVLRTVRELNAALGKVGQGEEGFERKQELLAAEQDRIARAQERLAEVAAVEARREAERGGVDERAAELARRAEEESVRARQQDELARTMDQLAARIDRLSQEQVRREVDVERVRAEIERKIRAILEDSIEAGFAKRARKPV
jgi:hypothetical protein